MLDKLRACIICKFYSQNGNLIPDEYKNHPTVRALQHEHIESVLGHYKQSVSNESSRGLRTDTPITESSELPPTKFQCKKFNLKIGVGNVSKYLNKNENSLISDQGRIGEKEPSESEPSQYNQDLITHKWMIYIRSAQCKRLDSYIKKVIFYLHSSYKPYDIVEVK